MLEVLNEICEQKKNVAIYTNIHNTSKFIFGRILAVNEDDIVIDMISPDGKFDGILATKIDKIYRIELDGQYAEKMKKLCPKDRSYSEIIFETNDLKYDLLSYAFESKGVLSIELIDSENYDIVGFVDELSDKQCKIKQVDEYGFKDGYSYIDIADITEISYNSLDEQRILVLYQKNYNTIDI